MFARALERGVPAGRIVLDSSDLYARDGRKLGLGSSAAEPAALAAVLEMIPAPARPESLAELRALMRRPELEPGSGADLAAALLGGVRKVVVRDGEPHVTEAGLPDDDIFLALIYSGVSQPTRHLVSLFRQRQDHPADDFRRGLEELRDAAHLVSTSWKFTPVLAMWVWAERYTEFLRACLKEAWIDAYDPVLELAARHQGIARPTGAGGGDCLLAAFEEEPDRAAFLHDCAQRNWQAWAIALGAEGVRAG
ncbi:MAG: hypothetical protein GMKNLPBB_00711 [Myxococcota bacterium]|nr:hypothetical protein [Myxococcota bacterium]